MKIEYKETTTDLQTRIDIHNQYGGRDIDQWMLELLQIQPGVHILDVGCGAGKQCFSYLNFLKGQAQITGGDVNEELLSQARLKNAQQGNPATFIHLDFNQRFPMDDNSFDLESCCFAIYYSEDIPFTIRELHRVLKPGGRLFTTGPMPTNKKLFYDVIREATNKVIPPMPGSSRYGSMILSTMQQTFADVQVHLFENPLTFDAVEPFIAYVRASLSEDRKLWGAFFKEKEDFERIMLQITDVAARRLANEGKLVMTKVVGGFIATK